MRPDMTSNVQIIVDRRKGVVTVPHKAIKREGARRFVLVLNGSLPEKRFVEVGAKGQAYTEIRAGLKEGDRVVVGELSPK